MKLKRGSTSVRRLVFIADSSSTTGAGLASLLYNTASLVAYYFAGDLANEVQITLATATLGTFASGGFIAVDNTNMPGWYEIGIPDAALDGGNECAIQLRGAANMVPVNIYIEIDAFDYQTATQPVNATQFAGQTITAAAGIPEVKVASIAANAVNASALATDAVTEIQSGLATQTSVDDLPTNAELATALGTADDAVLAAIATVQSDTNDIQTRLPAALESGRIAAVLDSTGINAIADQVWDEATSGHTTSGTYGGRIVRAANSNVEVQITGSYHIAADVHEFQSGVITAGDFASNSLTASALATDAVAEIQSGLATASALATQAAKINKIEAATSGTVTGAGTSTEVFVGPSATLTITVDSSGNRSAVVVT